MMLGINNQRYAQLASCNYDDEIIKPGPIVYSRTHTVVDQFHKLRTFGPCKLVTSFSDACVTQDMVDRLPDNVTHWYSNNVDCVSDRITALPIGFVFNIEREKIMLDVLSQFHNRSKLCYMNFTRKVPRTPNPREGIYEMLGGYSWVTTKGGVTHSSIPAGEFYHDLATHKYCISPPGAGPDCHRHWEAIAFGCIPIVLKCKANEVLHGFPHLAIDDWSQVTKELLSQPVPSYDEYSHMLDIRYWKDLICK